MTGPSLCPHAYVLAVHDLDSETAYFIDVLGFSREWSEAGNWEGLIRGDVRVHLGRCPESLRVSELGDHSYFGFFATDECRQTRDRVDGCRSSYHLATDR